MGSKGGGGGTTTVQKSDPWIGVQPYLVGSQARQLKPGVQPIYAQGGLGGLGGFGGGWGTGNTLANPESDYITVNSPGIYPEAQNLYQANGWSPQMQTNADDYADTLQQRMGQENIPYGFATNAMSGRYDPSITAGGNVDPQMVDPTLAFGSMGMANPTNSISQMLSGQANTDTLDPVVAAALRRMGESYGEQVMPSIRSGAIAAGQYGGSRQGVAEGLASKGLAYSMGDTAANMYNNAYNNAQQNMYGTANNMAGLGLSNAQNNANRDLQGQTTNVNTQLANNVQNMAAQQQVLNNRMQSLGMINTGNQMRDQNYLQTQGMLNAPNEFDWNNLNRYASIVHPGSGIGGESSTTNPSSTNSGASLLGGAMTGAQLGGLLGVGSGWGALGGAALMMSDRRTKTNIEAVGKMNNGLTVYRYRYKAGGPPMLGVMADEVKSVNPGAVVNVGGIDYVNYGEL